MLTLPVPLKHLGFLFSFLGHLGIFRYKTVSMNKFLEWSTLSPSDLEGFHAGTQKRQWWGGQGPPALSASCWLCLRGSCNNLMFQSAVLSSPQTLSWPHQHETSLVLFSLACLVIQCSDLSFKSLWLRVDFCETWWETKGTLTGHEIVRFITVTKYPG